MDPAAQGMGIGTRLVEPVPVLADGAGQPCYLETMTQRNVAWYRGLGFKVREVGIRRLASGETAGDRLWYGRGTPDASSSL